MTSDPIAALEILRPRRRGADAIDDEGIVTGLALAFAGIVRSHGQGQLSRAMRYDLVAALFRAEDAARAVLPGWFYDDRARHGFLSAFGLFNAWAEAPGSDDRRAAVPAGTFEIARIIANDLDSLCAGLKLERLDPAAPVTASALAARPLTIH